MDLGRKMAYLQGVLDTLEIDQTTKEGKLLVQLTEVMQQMVDTIDDLQAQVDDLAELCDVIDADLGDVEEEVFDCHEDHCGCHCHDDDDDDDDYDYDDYDIYEDEYDLDEDDELYEVQCPICEESVVLDESMLAEGSIECPCCGDMLEFDYIGDEEDEEDEEEADDQ